LSSLFIPLSINNTNYLPSFFKKNLRYHNSGIFAAAVLSLSYFWRNKNSEFFFSLIIFLLSYKLSTFASQFGLRTSSFVALCASLPLNWEKTKGQDASPYYHGFSSFGHVSSLLKHTKFPYVKPPVAENGVILGADTKIAQEFCDSIHSERLRSFAYFLFLFHFIGLELHVPSHLLFQLLIHNFFLVLQKILLKIVLFYLMPMHQLTYTHSSSFRLHPIKNYGRTLIRDLIKIIIILPISKKFYGKWLTIILNKHL